MNISIKQAKAIRAAMLAAGIDPHEILNKSSDSDKSSEDKNEDSEE